MLSHSIEIQEHLVTESPHEVEVGSGSSEVGEDVRGKGHDDLVVDDISVININLPEDSGSAVAGEAETEQGDNSSTNRGDLAGKGEGVSESTAKAWAGDEKAGKPGVLNVATTAAPAATETDKDKDSSSSDPMPASVVNVGFDL